MAMEAEAAALEFAEKDLAIHCPADRYLTLICWGSSREPARFCQLLHVLRAWTDWLHALLRDLNSEPETEEHRTLLYWTSTVYISFHRLRTNVEFDLAVIRSRDQGRSLLPRVLLRAEARSQCQDLEVTTVTFLQLLSRFFAQRRPFPSGELFHPRAVMSNEAAVCKMIDTERLRLRRWLQLLRQDLCVDFSRIHGSFMAATAVRILLENDQYSRDEMRMEVMILEAKVELEVRMTETMRRLQNSHAVWVDMWPRLYRRMSVATIFRSCVHMEEETEECESFVRRFLTTIRVAKGHLGCAVGGRYVEKLAYCLDMD